MSDTDKNTMVQEIGRRMLADPAYAGQDWKGISVVGNFVHGQTRMNGYLYREDGTFTALLPEDKDFAIMDGLLALRDKMVEGTGAAWHQCLLRIWKPGPEINIQFEYDDPDRWKVKVVSLDMSDYANSIKPPIG